jgi:hypothetical protein
MHDEWDISASDLAIGDQEVFCFAGQSNDPAREEQPPEEPEPPPSCNVIPFRARSVASRRSTTREAGQ